MSAVATVTKIDTTQAAFLVSGTIALSGNYGGASSHGDTLDLSTLGVPSGQLPTRVLIFEEPASGGVATLYRLLYVAGTTQANGLLQIMGAAAEYTEAAAYSPNFPNTIKFEALFPSL